MYPVIHRIVIREDADSNYRIAIEARRDTPASPWAPVSVSVPYTWHLYNGMIDKAAREVPRAYTVNVYHEGVNNPIEVLPPIKKASK